MSDSKHRSTLDLFETRRRERAGELAGGGDHKPLAMASVAFVASLVAWQLPGLHWLVYPFRLFVTFVHELSHGLAALLTGGQFIQFTVSTDTSGLAYSSGGWRWLIIPAGYLGSALFGGALLILTNRNSGRGRRALAIGLGVSLVLVTLLFARNWTAFVFGGLAGAALLLLGWRGPDLGVALGLNFLAIQCSLNALDSLIGLVRVSSRGGRVLSDAQSMADLTHLPALVWAVLWSGIALAILLGSLYLLLRGSESAPGEAGQLD